MTEIEKKGWSRIKQRLPEDYVWDLQEADRRNKKGRTIEEIVMLIR